MIITLKYFIMIKPETALALVTNKQLIDRNSHLTTNSAAKMLKDKNLGGEIIFPSYIPQKSLKMCVEPTVKSLAHYAKIKEFISEAIK